MEVRVHGVDQTLWFVPRAQHIAPLVREGIHRGRIWTAAELRDLASLDPHTRPEFVRVAQLKAAFGADIIGIVGGDEAPRHA